MNLALGKAQEYPDAYDPTLLQAVPRELSRRFLPDNLIFTGCDIWTAYEVSWLDKTGKPIVAVAEFEVPCESVNVVESKSFKYYLNSINQARFDNFNTVKAVLECDVASVIKGPIAVNLFTLDEFQNRAQQSQTQFGECIDDYPLQSSHVDVSSKALKHGTGEVEDKVVMSHLLKTNCPVTSQPDWASVWIGYSGRQITPESLLTYLVSFRTHQDFHEHCVERIFSDIQTQCQPERLWVYARYTRRGGLDINPFRCSEPMEYLPVRGIRQ